MDDIDFENTSGSDYGVLFKGLNLFVSFIAVVSGLSEITSGFDFFFQGIYVAALGALIGYLEFKIPPELFTYASSFFSFLGRGLIYILIAILNFHGGWLRILAAVLVLLVGLLYAALEFIPSIQAPENMQGEQGLATDVLDDVI
ncbi:unnamed protein product [Ambrosiozyma monospora]|uniref:Unnamed protein product n=1 Tax=Ambrosiozyma monospora TaxID=43982 RepID=A0A9W6Z323_AMBMO|nr:unnamed protein product [Ambrosiozyma monospora]